MCRLLRLAALAALVNIMFAVSAYSQQGELAQDCDGQVSRQPPYVNLSCSGWFIRLYTPSGKKWGRISGKTRAEVVQDLERGRKLDHKAFPTVQSNPNHSSYDYPSEPICDMCDPSAARVKPPWSAYCSNPSIADTASVRKSYLCTGAVAELEDEIRRLPNLRQIFGKLDGPNPFGDVFKVVGPWLNSLADAMKRVNDLRDKLIAATDWTEIDRGLSELKDQMQATDNEYNRLPDNVRSWLEGRYVAMDGVWVNEERGGMRIAQNGDTLRLYDAASGQLMWTATRNGDDYFIPAARRPYGIANATECGLSGNMVMRDISYTVHVSQDGRSLTIEEHTDRFVAGSCELGGTFTLGTWYKR